MSDIEDGGSAFPHTIITGQHNTSGMSLRDWFAGQALAGLLADPTTDTHVPPALAQSAFADAAYRFADAMLAERQKEREQ